MSSKRVLDPMERISENLFGLIMALNFTCTLGIATADNIKVQKVHQISCPRHPGVQD